MTPVSVVSRVSNVNTSLHQIKMNERYLNYRMRICHIDNGDKRRN